MWLPFESFEMAFQIKCRQAADMAKKAKDMRSEYVRESRKQAEKIRGLVSDLDGQYV
jgi:hypothetical protein